MKLVILAIFSALLLSFFFLFSPIHGDVQFFLTQIFLTKVHLIAEFAIPYFTPGFCGGMALAADAQNQLFTLSTPISFLFIDQYLTLRVAIFIYSIIFGVGIYFWFSYLPGLSPYSRAFAGMLAVTSGYWFLHMKFGHLAFHGIAYIPWLLFLLESLLVRGGSGRRNFGFFLLVTVVFFLMLNSGPIWAQLLLFLAIPRLIIEIITASKRDYCRLVAVVLIFSFAGLFALTISAARYVAIFEFVLLNFPREAIVAGVFGGTRHAFVATLRGLFDPTLIINSLVEPHLGGVHEWSAYLGLTSLIAILASLPKLYKNRRHTLLMSLCIGAALQFLSTVRPVFWQGIRAVFPIFNGLSYYYRGVVVIVFFLIAVIAIGLEALLQNRSKFIRALGCSLPFICGIEFLVVFGLGGFISSPQLDKIHFSSQLPEKIQRYSPDDLSRFSEGVASGGCYNPPINGYAYIGSGKEKFSSQVNYAKEIISEDDRSEFNINYVEKIFSPSNPRGFYKAHPWPLWPREKAGQLELFLQLKRGYEIPSIVSRAELVSALALGAWLIASLFVLVGMIVRARQ